MQADSALIAFTISRERFRQVLGASQQLEKIMTAEKSPAVVTTRLMRLQVWPHTCAATMTGTGHVAHARDCPAPSLRSSRA